MTTAYQPLPTDPRTALRDISASARNSPEIAALRLAILRLDIPDAIVQIDAVRQDDTAIAVKATIGLPGGARHSAIAAHDVTGDSGWAIQYAATEAEAIARALDGLGISLQKQIGATAPPAKSQTQPNQSPIKTNADDHLPEYSWNAFWREAHTRGISREDVERALGRSIQEVAPQEAVIALKSSGLWTS